MESKGRFICFEAIDGAGKTTAAQALAERLSGRGEPVDFLARKDTGCDAPGLQRRLELLSTLIWGYGDTPIERFGDHHAMFNVASWFSAIDLINIRPRLASGRSVVIDNWYYKFASRMTLKPGLEPDLIDACFRHLTVPDRVFFLRIDPVAAADRKTEFARGETGGFDGYGAPTREAFVAYQTEVGAVLEWKAARYGWTAIDAEGQGIEVVVDACLSALLPDCE